MAKVKRSLLKSIVKECLVEILMEGIESDTDITNIKESKRKRASIIEKKNRELELHRKKLDEQRVGDIANHLTKDPLMAEIFKDTAQTTLQEQIENRPGKTNFVPADEAAQVVFENDPSDIFSGAANWSELAFSSGKKP